MIRLIAAIGFLAVTLGGSIPSGPQIEERIIGGNPSKIEEIPYQVSLHTRTSFECGGCIISPTHILTAAHCVSEKKNEKIFVRAGTSTELSGGVVITAKKITIHPKFTMKTSDYNIAVIKLSTPLKFNTTMKAIKLADKVPADGESVRTSGWGIIMENGPRPYQLHSVVVPIVNRKTCENNYKSRMQITPRMICAGAEKKSACIGDCGGPLVYKETLVGIVSVGVGCGQKNYPRIYTNIVDPEIRKFIKEQANV